MVQTDAVCEATLEGVGSSLWGGSSAEVVSEAGGWQGALLGLSGDVDSGGQRPPSSLSRPFCLK